jgi:glyoxylase-like metal-dependent hydrolase (beta-lactamase superfamily II)
MAMACFEKFMMDMLSLAENLEKIKSRLGLHPTFQLMNPFKTFTGGPLETNAYFFKTPSGNLLFDAPQGSDEFFAPEKIDWLVLTHGHFDHVMDAAKIQRRHGCRVAFHSDTVPMLADGSFFKKHGFDIQYEACQPDVLLEEGETDALCGLKMICLHVPGHCPGSLCFYFPSDGLLVGGDVLFREGVGRWDLPGGDGPLLFDGIRKKLFTLDAPTRVLPGHGPETTIGHEIEWNPYVRPV